MQGRVYPVDPTWGHKTTYCPPQRASLPIYPTSAAATPEAGLSFFGERSFKQTTRVVESFVRNGKSGDKLADQLAVHNA